jgi:hypothetical protein
MGGLTQGHFVKMEGISPDEVIEFFSIYLILRAALAWGLTQPQTEMSIRNLPVVGWGGKSRPALEADNPLWASMTRYGDSFTFIFCVICIDPVQNVVDWMILFLLVTALGFVTC